MANKAFKYRIYPTDKQILQLTNTFGSCRFVYNKLLYLQKNNYKNGLKHLSKIDANNYCNRILKDAYPWLREVDKWALTNSIFALDNGFQRFFKRTGGHPKFKSKHKGKKSYTTNFANGNIKVLDDKIQLPKLGRVKAKIHRKPSADWKIKSATVSKDHDGSYFVSVLFEFETVITPVSKSTTSTIGLDYKSDGLYMDSEGHVGSNHKYYRESQKKLARAQRRLSRKHGSEKNETKSNNYLKQLKKVNRIHKKVSNQRLDNLHKTSTKIANLYDVVCVESLNMKAMSNKGFGNGKATNDNGYGIFVTMLGYKLAERGKYLVKVDKWYPSSQLCSCCGKKHPEMKITKSSHKEYLDCNCGLYLQRDINAAINIREEGLRLLRTA